MLVYSGMDWVTICIIFILLCHSKKIGSLGVQKISCPTTRTESDGIKYQVKWVKEAGAQSANPAEALMQFERHLPHAALSSVNYNPVCEGLSDHTGCGDLLQVIQPQRSLSDHTRWRSENFQTSQSVRSSRFPALYLQTLCPLVQVREAASWIQCLWWMCRETWGVWIVCSVNYA